MCGAKRGRAMEGGKGKTKLAEQSRIVERKENFGDV